MRRLSSKDKFFSLVESQERLDISESKGYLEESIDEYEFYVAKPLSFKPKSSYVVAILENLGYFHED